MTMSSVELSSELSIDAGAMRVHFDSQSAGASFNFNSTASLKYSPDSAPLIFSVSGQSLCKVVCPFGQSLVISGGLDSMVTSLFNIPALSAGNLQLYVHIDKGSITDA